MIRAEELMLGDVVTVNRSECVADGGHYMTWKQDGKIILIEKDYIRVQYEVDEGDDWDDWEEVDMKDIEPIPITPEILEKNGFYPIYKDEKSAYKWKEYDEGDTMQSIIIDFRVKRASEVWSDRTRKSYKGEIVYVHELQHIINLCGIPKNIEL